MAQNSTNKPNDSEKNQDKGQEKFQTFQGDKKNKNKGSKTSKDTSNNKNKTCQDWRWYAADENTAARIGSFPFAEALGESISLNNRSSNNPGLPGILRFNFVPTIGYQEPTPSAMINRIASKYFNSAAAGFTSGVNFEAADLVMTAIAGGSLIAWMAHIRKCFSLFGKFNMYNKYVSEKLIESCYCDYQQSKDNLSDFIAEYNIFAAQLNEILVVPKTFKCVERWISLSGLIFTDVPTTNSMRQFIHFYPMASFLWSADADPTEGTALQYMTRYEDGAVSLMEMLNEAKSLLQPLLREDVRQIFGAMRRVFNPSQCYTVSPINLGMEPQIVHDDIWLEQIHNTEWLPIMWEAGSTTTIANLSFGDGSNANFSTPLASSNVVVPVRQQDGYIYSRPTLVASSGSLNDTVITTERKAFLDMLTPNATPGRVLDATANKVCFSVDEQASWRYEDSNYRITPCYPRADFIIGCDVINIDDNHTYLIDSSFYIDGEDHATSLIDVLSNGYLSFNLPPILLRGSTGSSATRPIGEICNYTVIDRAALMQVNEKTIATLFDLPTKS